MEDWRRSGWKAFKTTVFGRAGEPCGERLRGVESGAIAAAPRRAQGRAFLPGWRRGAV